MWINTMLTIWLSGMIFSVSLFTFLLWKFYGIEEE
ncbi:hypothetical protein HNQ35_000264 [Cerasibacillus quisquiliarum]|nr:hypothetical protein [Cerasibacillus quisquiliarum]